MENYIGNRLSGRYELLKLIGSGGMANVFEAKDLLEDKIVYAGATLEEVTAETVKLAGNDWELISLYYGSDLTQSEADKIAAELEALDGGWEVTVFDGGQPLYPLLLSLE